MSPRTVCSHSGSSVHGILQARIPEWVDIAFSRGSSGPRDGTQVSCLASRFFTTQLPGNPQSGHIYRDNLFSHKVRPRCGKRTQGWEADPLDLVTALSCCGPCLSHFLTFSAFPTLWNRGGVRVRPVQTSVWWFWFLLNSSVKWNCFCLWKFCIRHHRTRESFSSLFWR